MPIIQLILVRPPSRISGKTQITLFNILKLRGPLVSSIAMLSGSVSLFAANTWLTSFLILNGCGPTDAGLILGLYFVAGAVSSPIFWALSEKIGGKEATFYPSIIAAIIAALILPTSHSLIIYVLCSITLGIFIAPY